jgi:hypothetical protein
VGLALFGLRAIRFRVDGDRFLELARVHEGAAEVLPGGEVAAVSAATSSRSVAIRLVGLAVEAQRQTECVLASTSRGSRRAACRREATAPPMSPKLLQCHAQLQPGGSQLRSG